MLYEVKESLPYNFYEIVKYSLTDWYFLVSQDYTNLNLYSIKAGAPLESVLEPVMKLLFTAHLPTTTKTDVATYVDVLTTHENPITVSRNLQENLNKIKNG